MLRCPTRLQKIAKNHRAHAYIKRVCRRGARKQKACKQSELLQQCTLVSALQGQADHKRGFRSGCCTAGVVTRASCAEKVQGFNKSAQSVRRVCARRLGCSEHFASCLGLYYWLGNRTSDSSGRNFTQRTCGAATTLWCNLRTFAFGDPLEEGFRHRVECSGQRVSR